MCRCSVFRFSLLLFTLLIAILSVNTFGQIHVTPTTTLAAEVANNTSAASSFPGLDNETPRAANVSKSATSALLYSGNSTKYYVHLMGWFGSTNHIKVGYSSTDPMQMHRQVVDMKSRGFAGAVLDWYGRGNMIDTVAGLLRSEAEANNWTFALTEDVGSVSSFAAANICDATQKTIDDLNYAYTTYEVSPAYLRVNGRPVVFIFGLDAYFVDWNKVRSQVSGNPVILFRNAGGITNPNSDGGFSWQVTNLSDSYDLGLPYLDNYYATAVSHPERASFGSGYPGFNDTSATWTGNRVQHRQCGGAWVKTMAEANKYYSSSLQMPFLQVVTWNDYEEGTAIEPGVDNCLNVFAYMSGSTLNWKLDGTGSPSTISYFRIFVSTDGMHLMRLKDVSAGMRSLSLSGYNLSKATTYTFYVKAIGKPSIQDQISGPVTFRLGDQPPLVNLTVTPTSGIVPLTVNVSVAGSKDPDGSVSSSKIDFGDGTILSGPTATHTYSVFDQYTVTARVFDNRGVASIVRATVNAKLPKTGVTLSYPVGSSTVDNFVRIAAGASAINPITAMRVYVDHKPLYLIRDDRIDTHLRLFDGNHLVVVNAWDSAGAVYQASANIKVGITTNQPPIAVVTLDTFTPAVGVTMRACSGSSHDPDGSVMSYVTDFGDGTPLQTGVTTYHQYKTPGSFTIKTTVMDNRGATDSTTASVTVH
jgi:PKD repeat protein